MKKKTSRITLNRETVRLLEIGTLRKVGGGCVPVSLRTCGLPCTGNCTVDCTVTSCVTVVGLNC
jgi:hypothetical protein